ncbi:MAG: hypothetical protein MJ201_02520 [Mycoplasmoidaceae bacterium]|nr:hypothetical protein [Mycoplasmoidaceae bacterium]
MPKQVEKTSTAVAAVETKPAEAETKPVKKTVRKTSAKKPAAKKPLVKEGASAKDTIEAKVNMFFESNKDNKDLKKILSVAKLMEAGAHVGLAANL